MIPQLTYGSPMTVRDPKIGLNECHSLRDDALSGDWMNEEGSDDLSMALLMLAWIRVRS